MRVDHAAHQGRRILLIEDDHGIGRFLHRGLTAEGYSVDWQTSGRPGQTRLNAGQFHAAIIDRGLPDLDGADLCRNARDKGITLPICMLTARGSLEDRLEGFRCGADDYLAKPFSFEELLARLSVMIRRSMLQENERLIVGNLLLDARGRRGELAGEVLNLSRREFDLLFCLARQSDQVVSRTQILNEVWGTDAEVTENAVDVYVGYVRRLLSGPQAPVIATVRGIGFVLRHRTKA
ncbi:response regulator transcription factor [Novosphingobium sp. KACC 22771]|uniref:response regulator transcription factor n=1 Tax=Novosphingobium sp. KACC 22771 TaxID=3025670 RepID=UPI002366E889|nr:response regulator transcription factor [Novosphingobium sp. KACC 22771]WDF70951.1 response regulator transcription factor [Novosphingobium sp. KACC 22771]